MKLMKMLNVLVLLFLILLIMVVLDELQFLNQDSHLIFDQYPLNKYIYIYFFFLHHKNDLNNQFTCVNFCDIGLKKKQ
jgi:hypothetical protein